MSTSSSFLRQLACSVALVAAAATFGQTGGTVPASAQSSHRGPAVGEPAPDFTVTGPDGKELKLSDFRGKLVLVDIWATWCGPCVAAMPHNSELAAKLAGDGLVILAICTDDSRENYDGWLERNGGKYRFLTAHDPAGQKGWAASVFNTRYGVSGFPTLFLIGRDGRLIGQASGGGAGENPSVTRLLAKGGLPVDVSHLPPEEPGERKSIPMVGKTPALRLPMVGMGGATPAGGGFGSLKAGEAVPDFTAQGADGKPVKLSDFKGKTVIVSFFSNAERGPEAYAPVVAAKYAAQDVVLLAVGSAMEPAAFDQWRAKAQPAYAAAWDPAGKAWGECISHMNFGVGMFPALAVVTKDGKLSGGFIGMGDKNVGLLHALLQTAGVKLAAEDLPQQMPAAMIQAKPGGMAPAATTPLLAVGAAAPDFLMKDVAGKDVHLADFKGKVVVLDFWATWCGPCLGSFPHTQELAAKYQDQGVVVLASGTSDTAAKFREWIPANQSKYPNLVFAYDPHERDSATFAERASSRLYHVTGIPTQFVIGRDGQVTGAIVGNGGAEDARTELALARAGVKVDEAILARGRAQLAKSAAAQAAAAKQPRAPFRESYGKLKAGQALPDFTVLTPEGKEAKFSDYARGKTVVLDFWATWCGPCQQAMPHYEEISRQYRDQGVVILGVCSFDTREAYAKWLKDNQGKYTFPTVFDPVGKPAAGDKTATTRTVMVQLTQGVMSPLPTTLVVNAAGQFVGVYSGYGPDAHGTLANLLMLAGVKVPAADQPKVFFPAGATAKAAPVAAAALSRPAPAMAPAMTPAAPPALLAAGAVAPDFVMQDAAGRDVKLSDFKGKVVVLDFWATWCGPCIASMPHTQELAAKYRDQGVVVVAAGTSDTIAKFKQWIPANQAKYPNLIFGFDPHERGSATFDQRASSRLYHVTGIPTQFVIGRDGVLTAAIVGYDGKEDVRTEAALARAGVPVAPAVVTEGERQLKAAAEAAAAQVEAVKEAAKHPRPPFYEDIGQFKAGAAVPDFVAEDAAGQPVHFAALTRGKTVVLTFWSGGHGVDDEAMAFNEAWSRRYADQGVLWVGLGAYAARADYDQWRADKAGKYTYPVLFDPAGKPPVPAKEPDAMTADERKDFKARTREHFGKVIPMAFTGGVMMPVPNTFVIDAQGRLLGLYVGAGKGSSEALANLLLRAGIKLAPEDQPKRIWTAAETKTKPPEDRIPLLKVGAKAPDFPATDAAGQAVKLSDFRGKVVILDFWATWCGPCLASMPHTQEVAAHYRDQGVVVVASCTSDARTAFDSWVKRNQEKYPNILFSHDPEEKSPRRASHRLYGVGGIPQQFIIDREGTVVALVTGYLKGEAILDAALAKAGVKVDPALVAKGADDLKRRE